MIIYYDTILVKSTNKVMWIDIKYNIDGKKFTNNYLKFIWDADDYISTEIFSKKTNDLETNLLIRHLIKNHMVTILRIPKTKTYILKLTPNALLTLL